MRIHRANTILYCSNWTETVAFYRDVLDLPMSLDRGWFVEFQLGEDSFVSIADSDHASIAPGHGAGITLSWQVDDLVSVRTTLVNRGATCGPISRRWGSDSTFLLDPENHRIELWSSAVGSSGRTA